MTWRIYQFRMQGNSRIKCKEPMTEKKRKEIAKAYRRKLDTGTLRKNAIKEICEANAIDRATLYRYCQRHNVKTN